MMPKEEILDYSNEDKEIQMVMNNKDEEPDIIEDNKMEIDISEPGPSKPKKAKTSKKSSPADEVITISSDGFVSVNNTSMNPSKSKKRKKLRHTIDEVKSMDALKAQRDEQERLKRLEQQRNNTSIYDTYMPVQVPVSTAIIGEPIIIQDDDNDIDVIEINSDDEDDMPEVIGVFQNPKAEVKFNGYPYRVAPPMPSGPMYPGFPQCNNQYFQPANSNPYVPNNIPMNNGYPPNNLPVNNGYPNAYVDSRTRNVMKAREDEENRLRRQRKHNKDLDSIERTEGRLLVNLGKPEEEPPVYVAQHLTDVLKPHQLGGIRFMYENVIESLQTYKETAGVGCVLAHSMGLGKTLQIISFVDIFFRTVEAKHVLIICPVNVIQNWMTEFNRWLPIHGPDGQLIRKFTVFLLGDSVKGFEGRRDLILSWRKEGGVLLMGYDMYRIFLTSTNGKQNKSTENKKVLKRTAPEDSESKISDTRLIRKALCEPGPDLIICDEGHKIKSLKTSVSSALNQVRTKRRIVLTGYPLQNNLLEYYCMVDFVRPSYLGSKKEFMAMYDRPIKNGQCMDSTPRDIKIAQQKIYLLTQALRGFVQRRSAHLLKRILPQNLEYVIIVRKTPIQHELYRAFVLYTKVEMYSAKTKYYNPLKAYSIGTKIWNHPDLLYYAYHKQRTANGNGVALLPNGGLPAIADKMRILQTNTLTDYFQIFPNSSSSNQPKSEPKPEIIDIDDPDLDEIGGEISYDWAQSCLVNYEITKPENSNKFVIAFEILKETVAKGEKILLFSSSVMTLNLIENVLSKVDMDMKDENGTKITWRRGLTYCKFDGSTPATEREKLIDRFNASPKLHLFLISTKAGSLGINLVAANRVIIFDASWNPCHDAQAVCRVYRYGQQKKTFVYRLVMHNSMEKAIFYRQISKHGLQQKVVDELEVEAKITNKQLEDLLQYDEALDININPQKIDSAEWNIEDEILKNVASRYTSLIAEAPFLHESMILEAEEKLSEQEKIEAELLLKAETSAQLHNGYIPSASSSHGGSINLSRRPDFEAMVREYNQQNFAYRGSLRDLHSQVEYSELGLHPVQYKIADQNSIQSSVPPPLLPNPNIVSPLPLQHPLHRGNGSLYRMNNAPVTRELPKYQKSITTVDEDIELPIMHGGGRTAKLCKGEQVFVIKMSDKTYLKRSAGGNEIIDATLSKYHHNRNNDNSVIELD